MSLLIQLTIILAFALVLVPMTKSLGLPSLLGYVITGIMLGPFALNLIDLSVELKQLQHLGLLFLLFLVGMQLHPARLISIRKQTLQLPIAAWLILSSLGTVLGVFALGLTVLQSLVISGGLSLLSFSLLQQQLNTILNSRITQKLTQFGLVQSLIAAIFMAMLPLFNMASPQHGLAYVMSLVAAISGLYLLQRYVLQPVFDLLEKTHTHELILASAVFSASLSFIALEALGIHATLAAMLAGFLISDSRFEQRLKLYIRPLQGLVFAAFFIVLGLSLPLQRIVEQPLFLGLGLITLLLVKMLLYVALNRYFKASWPDSTLSAAALLSSGEFGFILLYMAFEKQIANAALLEPYLILLMLSFLLSPFLFIAVQRYLLPRLQQADTGSQHLVNAPLLIIGFGRFGQLVARVAHLQHTPFTAIDSHLKADLALGAYGGSLHVLDATDATQLETMTLAQVKVTVIAVDDVEDNINIVRYLQLNYPEIELFVRARDRHHAHLLKDLGIAHIWRETYLSALELAEQSLASLNKQDEPLMTSIEEFRIHDQTLQRQQQHIEYDDTKLYQTQEAALDELAYLFQQDAEFKAKRLAKLKRDLSPSTSQQMKLDDL